MEIMIKGVRSVWTARKHVTIDNSMIQYMVRAVTYVLYMPTNMIKHSIKVFSIFCALSAILIGLKVYVGQEDDYDNTALGIFDDMVKEVEINIIIC